MGVGPSSGYCECTQQAMQAQRLYLPVAITGGCIAAVLVFVPLLLRVCGCTRLRRQLGSGVSVLDRKPDLFSLRPDGSLVPLRSTAIGGFLTIFLFLFGLILVWVFALQAASPVSIDVISETSWETRPLEFMMRFTYTHDCPDVYIAGKHHMPCSVVPAIGTNDQLVVSDIDCRAVSAFKCSLTFTAMSHGDVITDPQLQIWTNGTDNVRAAAVREKGADDFVVSDDANHCPGVIDNTRRLQIQSYVRTQNGTDYTTYRTYDPLHLANDMNVFSDACLATNGLSPNSHLRVGLARRRYCRKIAGSRLLCQFRDKQRKRVDAMAFTPDVDFSTSDDEAITVDFDVAAFSLNTATDPPSWIMLVPRLAGIAGLLLGLQPYLRRGMRKSGLIFRNRRTLHRSQSRRNSVLVVFIFWVATAFVVISVLTLVMLATTDVISSDAYSEAVSPDSGKSLFNGSAIGLTGVIAAVVFFSIGVAIYIYLRCGVLPVVADEDDDDGGERSEPLLPTAATPPPGRAPVQ